MPLSTTVTRDGKRLAVPWGSFHIAAMTLAAAIDSKQGKLYDGIVEHEPTMITATEIPLSPGNVWALVGYHIIAATPLNDGNWTMKGTMTFIDTSDDERFVLEPGDVLSAWRS